ncbi:MAG: HDOD domain-containing protein [Deltaproteobacteria bacterium]|nr:HDOD domain-containing protein [Deltaproteobacteria bacterium]
MNNLLEKIEDLPSSPSSVAAMLDVLNNPDSSARELSEALRHDQSLTSRVLRRANSSCYGLPRKTDNL